MIVATSLDGGDNHDSGKVARKRKKKSTIISLIEIWGIGFGTTIYAFGPMDYGFSLDQVFWSLGKELGQMV